jgi:diguanylate cyclase (GGDEF)-like protein/PAS domain S-box-containing protein
MAQLTPATPGGRPAVCASAAGLAPLNYCDLAEYLPDLIVRFDRQGCCCYANPAWEKANGVPAANVLGKTPAETPGLVAEEAETYRQWLLEAMDSDTLSDQEFRFPTPDGGSAVRLVLAIPEHDLTGEVAGLLTIARDITPLKKAEERLKMAESMARLGYWQWDCHRPVVTVSSQLCRILGRPEGWTPTPDDIFAAITDDDRDWLRAALKVTLASQAPDAVFDYRIQVSDRVLDVHSALRIVYDAAGNPLRLVGTTQDVSELRTTQERLHSLAFYDPVTELPNRELFGHRLHATITQANYRNHRVVVLILDLDNFKSVNETLGHAAGDQLLRETADRLQQCLCANDTIARLGGDEFGLILGGLHSDAEIAEVCQALLALFDRPFRIDNAEIFVTGSIGIVRYPEDSGNLSELLQFADAAMYRAKESGRNTFQFYSSSLTAQATERLSLAAGLHRAEANGELEIHFQPQMELATRRLVGAEGLLRWNHPEYGLVPPDKFIGIAEDTGQIVSIGEWVLREACLAAYRWNRKRRQPLTIAVNLSARQFRGNTLVDTIRRIFAETGCRPSWIELEITESLLLDDSIDVGNMLEDLHRMGVSIALDDFGTGYSALSYLIRFPVESIKIDRSFVRDSTVHRNSAELVKAIVSMAHSLEMTIVAEGIEETCQEEFLATLGCQRGQGYLYGRPLPRAAFETLLASG